MQHLLPIIAPQDLQISAPSPTELDVIIIPNAVATGVKVYKVKTTGDACDAAAILKPHR